MLMMIQTTYVTLEYLNSSQVNWSPYFQTFEKISELSVGFIIYHFVLELLPVIVILDPLIDTIERQIRLLRLYKVFYYTLMITAAVNSIVLLVIRCIDYFNANDYFTNGNLALSLEFGTSAIKFVIEFTIFSVFLWSVVKIYRIRSKMKRSAQTIPRNDYLSVAIIVTVFIL